VSPAHAYLEGLPFPADRFQYEAADAIDRGESVVVTAPTGSGKTVVAEAAIARARALGQRALYTTPIKALSNQKFGELRDQYGAQSVGLLTGDNSINGSADVVVMTTEVLRNMMYAASPDLDGVGVVVLDEVHYLQDRARGAVWEEIIIHLDRAIPLVCLSATVANAEEFAGWIGQRRGATRLVVETERPVPLDVAYLVRDSFSGHELRLFPAFSGDRPNERLASMLRRDRGRRHRYVAPRRFETCAYLQQRNLLPAIYFLFSRKGCEAAARTVVERGLRLTSAEEADRIEEIAHRVTAHLDPLDLQVLGFSSLLALMRRGVAPHHAGMVPALKEAVEQLFAAGLIKLVFATETLALGINMPARTVALESLSKFTGDGHETLQPGDFTQLTGRAGRRGIDTDGTAVVLHSPYLEFERVAGIAARGSHALRSSFRPTYNMAVNLIARYDRPTAELLLGSSFAEYHRSRQQVDLAAEIEADEVRIAELRTEASHPSIDVFAHLDDEQRSHAAVMARLVGDAPPGTVLEWDQRGRTEQIAVVAVGRGKQPRVLGVNAEGDERRIASGKLPANLRIIGQIELPTPFRPRNASYRAEVARVLAAFEPIGTPVPAYEDVGGEDISRQLDAARAVRRLERRVEARRRRAASTPPAIVERFEATRSVLQRFDYVAGWSLTAKGEQLRTIYNELDLVLAESLASGLWGGLGPAEVAGVASCFTYQARGSDDIAAWVPELDAHGATIDRIWQAVTAAERDAGLEPSRQPDPGFAPMIMAWTRGSELHELFDEDDGAVGDFVRNARQLVDLLRQIEETGTLPAGVIATSLGRIDRGVVAAAGAV
jgi:ATP-dependent RNA helicase HelY